MEKYYGVRRFCTAIVEAYKAGAPMNPMGCSGHSLLYMYRESDSTYDGVVGIFGHYIQASNAKMLCASINKALDEGYDVNPARAYPMGMVIKVPLGKKGMQQEPEGRGSDAIEGQTEPLADVIVGTAPDVSDVGKNASESLTEPLNGTADAAVAKPDLDHAKALTKKQLQEYAATFEITLDSSNAKGTMLTQLKAALDGLDGNKG